MLKCPFYTIHNAALCSSTSGMLTCSNGSFKHFVVVVMLYLGVLTGHSLTVVHSIKLSLFRDSLTTVTDECLNVTLNMETCVFR